MIEEEDARRAAENAKKKAVADLNEARSDAHFNEQQTEKIRAGILSPSLSSSLLSFVYVSFDMNEDLEKEKQAKEELQASLAGLLGLTGGAAGGVRAKLSAGRKASGDAGDKH